MLQAQSEPQVFEKLGKIGASKNDPEVKVEKAIIELNEIKNNIEIKKNEELNKSDSKS